MQAKAASQEGTRPDTAQPPPGNASGAKVVFPKQAAAQEPVTTAESRTCAAEATPSSAAAVRRNASGAKTALKQVAAKAPPVVYPLPMTREEAVQNAVEGILRAWKAGKPPVQTPQTPLDTLMACKARCKTGCHCLRGAQHLVRAAMSSRFQDK